MALWCEVEFFQIYEKQKTFADLDIFLRDKGYNLYGLYPHYVSTKRFDRKNFETEERIAWADAIYFKDPLDEENRGRAFTQRELDVLLLTAMITGYYDYAMELIASFYNDNQDKELLVDLVMELSSTRKQSFMTDMMKLMGSCQKSPEKAYLLMKKFVDNHASNSNIDFINVEE
jgi:hypothetical protein